MKNTCRRDDWDCICEMPRTRKQRSACARMGFIDTYRVDSSGRTRRFEGELTPQNLAPRIVPLEKAGTGTSKKVGTRWKASAGSPLFTSTTKVHTPSWSLPMGATCPVVRTPVTLLVKEMARTKKRMSNEEVIARLKDEIPQKCLACYAMTGNYPKKQTQDAMARRLRWFNETRDDRVVETLVKAISVAGDEKCTRESKKCVYTPEVPPTHFRLFDSGDFMRPRDVRIWHQVAKRLPNVKFWMPTTAWAAPCDDDIRSKKEHSRLMNELRSISRLPNVIVRPSATSISTPAPRLKGFAAGSAVVEKDFVKKHGGREGKFMTVCDTTSGGKKTACSRHYVCPGNCGTCKACWHKNVPVVYIRHGLTPDPRNVLEIFNRVVGTHVPPASEHPETYRDANRLLQRQFVQWTDIGPWGGKLPSLQTRTPEEIEKTREQIRKMRAKKAAAKSMGRLDTRRWR